MHKKKELKKYRKKSLFKNHDNLNYGHEWLFLKNKTMHAYFIYVLISIYDINKPKLLCISFLSHFFSFTTEIIQICL